MHELFPEDEISFESLVHQHNVISLEAITVSQMFNASQGKLGRFLGDTVRYLKNRLSIFSPTIYNVDERKLMKLTKTVDFASMMPMRVVGLDRFSSTWVDYTTLLGRCHEQVMPLQKDLLSPFETFLGMVLNSPEHMRSLGSIDQLPKRPHKPYDELSKAFEQSFKGRPNTQLTYGDVVGRHADVEQTATGLNNLNNDFATLSRSKLVAQVGKISDLLGLLNNKIKSGDNESMSGPFAKSLSDLTFAVAQDVEFYSVYGYRLETFTKSVDDSFKLLVKNLN